MTSVGIVMSDNALKNLYLGLILFGLLLGGIVWYMENDSLDRLLMPPVVICIGAGVLLMARLGLRTGRIRARSGHVYRDKQPVLFWLMIVICLAGGLALVLGGLGKLLG